MTATSQAATNSDAAAVACRVASSGFGSGGRAIRPEVPVEPNLEQLAARCQDGDDEAFAHLVRESLNRVFNFLVRLTGNTHDAEDLAQETFLKAHQAIQRYDVSRPFLPWLFTIARRSALNHLRRARPSEPLPLDFADHREHSTPASKCEAIDENAHVWQVARRLKPKQHEVLWLCYGEGFTIAETAAVMRTNAVHVKVLLHRARRALAAALARPGAAARPPRANHPQPLHWP